MARILVVDDEEGVRSFVAECLDLDGHDVSEASDGLEAIGVLARQGIEVLVTDLKMPRLDGMGLLRHVREESPEVEVILLTAHGSVDSAVEAMKLGAFDYLRKPLESPKELRLLVRRAEERYRLRAIREVARTEDVGPKLTWGAPSMVPVVRALQKVARTDATVLLLGESGTGKEVAARSLHGWSRRAEGPFVAVNCATLSETLLESELFGHEKGAFTGADARRRGKLELAAGGTFFLDEIGELPPTVQAKLLRVLQEKTFERVGGSRTLKADVRFIAATNRDLKARIADGRFRDDLYHRVAVFPIHLPPLRERADDLLPLAECLLAAVAKDLAMPELTLAPEARAALLTRAWSGNVRELRNALERAAILGDGLTIRPADLAEPGAAPAAAVTPTPIGGTIPTMEEAERQLIESALEHYEGNRRKAAEHLGIGVRTLYDKLKRFGMG